jgi:hypothetical protein
MNEVLKVIEHGGKQAVNTRDLHAALEVGRDFSTWIKEREAGSRWLGVWGQPKAVPLRGVRKRIRKT